MDRISPSQQALVDASAEREKLAARYLGIAEVSTLLGRQSRAGRDYVSQMRREGKLLAVYVTHPRASYRYPDWQFCSDGQPVGQLGHILKILRDFGPFEREPDGLRRTTGWGELEWFLSPHALLDGATPAASLATDPLRVVLAARVEFESELLQDGC
uniref:Uncharacterized protein n=1 Tax=Knufia peltigerae TaxID=1002370 RepID=A0AA38Y0K8_9EURO|nr:hypothetical protein H2204_008162 [Knufia peltigerae]